LDRRLGGALNQSGHGAEEKNSQKILIGRPEEKRPLGRWKGNIKIDLNEIRCGSVDLIHVIRDRVQWRT